MRTILLLPILLFLACSKDTPPQSGSSRVFYEIFLRSFSDSDGDGIGDIRGLIEKLDYLEELGVGGIWLMPVHPSKSYHKYDVMDYYGIDPEYGTMADFRELLAEAHRRDMQVIIDLVLNHTDDEHPWFQAALDGPESPFRSFYVWADPDTITEERHLWHQQPADGDKKNQTNEYFYGFFWKGMPDLNYDYPPVRDSLIRIGKYWLENVGVDGFRLDGALFIYPYYHSRRDEYLPKTIAWWTDFHREMEAVHPNTFLVGEVWQSDSVLLSFLSSGLDAAFHFDLSRAILQTVKAGYDTLGLARLDADYQTQFGLYSFANPQRTDALFLTNHDQDRLRSELDGNWDQAKMAAALLLTLPGTPFIYYGEELGMLGKKPDERIREPFPWGQGPGQTSWEPVEYNTPENTPPLSLQKKDEHSLWNHYRRLIHFRNEQPVMEEGRIQPFDAALPDGTLGFYRQDQDRRLLVLHQLGASKAVIFTGTDRRLLFSTDPETILTGDTLRLMPYSTAVLE
ncbi:MAG: DUF3459 domain-containing protein [Lewinellaceae bacterium]|nr:DUF3459 domain-containing protein [Lewinellaceae bacterium]